MKEETKVKCPQCRGQATKIIRFSDIPQLSNEVVDVSIWCDNCDEYVEDSHW